jgi:hypothetical protein
MTRSFPHSRLSRKDLISQRRPMTFKIIIFIRPESDTLTGGTFVATSCSLRHWHVFFLSMNCLFSVCICTSSSVWACSGHCRPKIPRVVHVSLQASVPADTSSTGNIKLCHMQCLMTSFSYMYTTFHVTIHYGPFRAIIHDLFLSRQCTSGRPCPPIDQ